MKAKIALDGTQASSGAVTLERMILAVFAACTLLMPLLYLPVNYFIAAAIILILSVVAAAKCRSVTPYSHMRKLLTRHPGLVLFIVALITRLVWVTVVSLHTKQVSDFLGVYEDSLQNTPSISGHAPIWTHYITYPYMLHFLVDIFGRSTLVGGIFNAITCSISVLLTYLVGTSVANRKVGVLAASLMLLWPGMAVYTAIYAPDHLSILFTLLGTLCFIKFMEAKVTKVKLLYALACALSLWVLGFFKDIAPILAIAFAVVVALAAIKSGRLKPNLVTIYCTLGLCVLAVFSSVTHVPIISAIAGRPVNPSLVSYFIYTGLGGNDSGSWQPAIMSHYTQLIAQDNYNYGLANHRMLREALSSVKHRLPEIPATIWNKSRDVQADDGSKISWVEQSAAAANSNGLLVTLQTIVEPVNSVFFAGIVILIGAGVYYAWKDRSSTKLILLVTVCIGYSLLLLIIEAQNRYRYIIEPLYCILAAYGLVGVYNAYSKLQNAH